MIPERVVGRLSQYRRFLMRLKAAGNTHVYSHNLAEISGGTAAQVRRDMMTIGATGSPTKGYEIDVLVDRIGQSLDAPSGQKAVLVGAGNLGKALLHFFSEGRTKLSIAAVFDNDPAKQGQSMYGCDGCICHHIDKLEAVVKESGADVGIITVPSSAAQEVADCLSSAGVKGILNFAPITITVDSNIYVEDIDMTMSLEKVAYFARGQVVESV
jgi:redox-sensing transcriptional repressor